jgi:demethylmenaquinone methyltransferase/2-methoxy-6-polyprenyl-1,4-benzoquinol methylase
MKVADVATGTGLTARVAVALTGWRVDITCFDTSPGMLDQARLTRCATNYCLASADDLGALDNEFDFAIMAYALWHMENLSATFREFYRVLKPGGRVCLLDLTRPKHPLLGFVFDLYFRHCVPCFARLLTKNKNAARLMSHVSRIISGKLPPEGIVEELNQAGFTQTAHCLKRGMFSEYAGVKPNLEKHRAAMGANPRPAH